MGIKKGTELRTFFGVYRVTGELGAGGSGTVHSVEDEDGKPWAVKVLKVGVEREKIKRFKNEMDFCRRNRHPGIVEVIDQGVHEEKKPNGDTDRMPFYVMVRYRCPLRDLMNESKIPPDLVMHYFTQMLDSVEALHLSNAFHRDTKPENFLYNESKDTLLLADLGIAHFAEEDLITSVQTRTGKKLANFLYAAPEQKQRGASVDHRADIFGLGLILNELFTGEVPQGVGFKTIGQMAPEYGYLDELVHSMIQSEPSKRPASIEVVKRELIKLRVKDVVRQKLNQLDNTVVPTTDPKDGELIRNPPRLVGVDYVGGRLSLFLKPKVDERWRTVFKEMPDFCYRPGIEPIGFELGGSMDRMDVSLAEKDVQEAVDRFKKWVSNTNAEYERQYRKWLEERENQIRADLQLEREALEARRRVLDSVKI